MAEGQVVYEISGDNSQFAKDAEKTKGIAAKAFEGVAKIGKATFAAIGTAMIGATAGAVKLLTESVKAYSEYEQLAGGVETLFKESADTVGQYAANAYKTAGISANDYLETVTSFSASLLQSLGGDTEEAAKVADMAIIDMADNANKMGTSMESIQAAYQGFAKQNYTLLDNLKLGYGGTKSEMERLLKDAQAITGVKYDIENLNDVYEAIHVVQEELGIAGATAEEAATTIQGSAAATRAAWANLVAGLATDGADLDGLITDFVDSLTTTLTNVLPVVRKGLQGIAKLVQEIVPMIAEQLPAMIDDILPPLLDAALSIVEALVAHLPELISTFINLATSALQGITEIFPIVITALIDAFPQVVQAALDLFVLLVNALADNADQVIVAVLTCIGYILQTLLSAETFGKLLNAAGNLIDAIVQGLFDFAGNLLKAALDIVDQYIIQPLKDAWTQFKEVGADIVNGIIEGVSSKVSEAVEKIKEVAKKLLDGAKDFLGIKSPSKEFRLVGKYVDEGLSEGIEDFSKLPEMATNEMVGNLLDGVKIAPTLDYSTTDPTIGGLDEISNALNRTDTPADMKATLVLDGQVVGSILLPFIKGTENRIGTDVTEGTAWSF